MTPSPSLVRLGRAVAGSSVLVALAAMTALAGYGRWDLLLGYDLGQQAVIALGFGTVAWIALIALSAFAIFRVWTEATSHS